MPLSVNARACMNVCICVRACSAPEKGERPAPPLGPPHPRTTMAPTYADLSTLECSDVWLSHRTSTLSTSPRKTHTQNRLFYNAINWIPEHLVSRSMRSSSGDPSTKLPRFSRQGIGASSISALRHHFPLTNPLHPWLQPTQRSGTSPLFERPGYPNLFMCVRVHLCVRVYTDARSCVCACV